MSKRLSALCQQFKAETAKNTVLFYVVSQPLFKATGAELTDLRWLCITTQKKSVSHEIQIHLSLSKKPKLLSIRIEIRSGWTTFILGQNGLWNFQGLSRLELMVQLSLSSVDLQFTQGNYWISSSVLPSRCLELTLGFSPGTNVWFRHCHRPLW